MEQLSQFGLQRSGANFTHYLLTKNYDCEIDQRNGHTWKHGYYREYSHDGIDFEQEKHVVITIKDPFSWLVSVYNYFKKYHKQDFPQFIRTKWAFEGYVNSNPIYHWNRMYDHWSTLMLDHKRVAVVKYEDLLKAPEHTLDAIAGKFKINKVGQSFIVPKNRINPSVVMIEELFDAKYYSQRKYIEEYTLEDIHFIKSQLSKPLMNKYYPAVGSDERLS